MWQSVRTVLLPPRSILFPGSFDPPHAGHVALVQAAAAATATTTANNDKNNRATTSTSTTAFFELSLANADKPSLSAEQITKRLRYFEQLFLQSIKEQATVDGIGAGESSSTTIRFPAQWGVLLTNAPLFQQKVDLLHPLQVQRASSMFRDEYSAQQPMHFVIGTDTLVRLLNPKYYNNDANQMYEILTNMPCQFVVGGRLEQIKSSGSGNNNKQTMSASFLTGQEEIDQLPTQQLRDKFTLLPNFRVDISSTEIRQQLNQQQS